MLTALLRDKYLSRYMVFTFLLSTSVFSFDFIGSNLRQLTAFTLFSVSLSFVLLINIVACVCKYIF